MPETEDIKFYNAQDGVRGRDGGPYADQEDAEHRETRRAKAEDREPDYDNLQPFVGTQIVTSRFVEDNTYSNPSMLNAPGPNEALDKVVEDANFLVNPNELPVDTRTTLPDSERDAQREDIQRLAADPANVATVGMANVESGNDRGGNNSGNETSAGGSNTASAQSNPGASKKSAAKRTAAKR